MKKNCIYLTLACTAIIMILAYTRRPLFTGSLTKQTVYLWLLNVCHPQSTDARATALLIDDDSGDGIYRIRQICNELGIKATFAVIPSRLDEAQTDSLRLWQRMGYGIALHGYNHDRWKEWSIADIKDDIERSEQFLLDKGFLNNYQYVVPPHACNTQNIRKAIHSKGYLMITGANIINQDTTVFQYGRFSLDINTDIEEARQILNEAYRKKAFVVFGTHSSMTESFSEQKTKDILSMAKAIGFKFI